MIISIRMFLPVLPQPPVKPENNTFRESKKHFMIKKQKWQKI